MLALNVTPPRNGEVHKVVLLGFLVEPTERVAGVKGQPIGQPLPTPEMCVG